MEALTQHLYYQALIYNHEQYHFLKLKVHNFFHQTFFLEKKSCKKFKIKLRFNPHQVDTQITKTPSNWRDWHKYFKRAPSFLKQMAEGKLNRTCELNPTYKINFLELKLFEMRRNIEKKDIDSKLMEVLLRWNKFLSSQWNLNYW